MIVPLDENGKKMQEENFDILGCEEILSQLSEECNELAHAAQKLRRVHHGTTPVCYEEAKSKLDEEAGDVMLMLDYLMERKIIDHGIAIHSAIKKNERWYKRTFGDKTCD